MKDTKRFLWMLTRVHLRLLQSFELVELVVFAKVDRDADTHLNDTKIIREADKATSEIMLPPT